MKTDQIINNLSKLCSIKRMNPNDYKLHESNDYVSDGYIILLKTYEPTYWKKFRYNKKLEENQVEKLMSKAKDSNNELTLNDGIWLKYPDFFKLIGPRHTTYVNPSYLVLLKNIHFYGSSINLGVLKFKQTDNNLDPVFIEHAGSIVGAIMPCRFPEDKL